MLATESAPRLRRINMAHGIMRGIVRHQIERSEYEKLETQRRERVRRSLDGLMNRKESPSPEATPVAATDAQQPELNSPEEVTEEVPSAFDTPEYQRMRRRIKDRLESQMKSSENEIIESMATLSVNAPASPPVPSIRKKIFTLKITHQDKLVVFDVHNDDIAARKAKEITRELNLNNKQCRHIMKLIEKNMDRLN